MELEALTQDAFAALGVEVGLSPALEGLADIVIEPAGLSIPVRVRWRSLVDEQAAERLLAAEQGAGVLLLVGERVTEAARRKLLASGAGYLDLRGHLALKTQGLVVSADVPTVRSKHGRSQALAGKVGLEVATSLLLSPGEPVAVRALARQLGRSPSTVSQVLTALRTDGLIDERNEVTDTALFWRVAERWPATRTYLANALEPHDDVTTRALRLGLDPDAAVGWALTDTSAAVGYGAPVAYRAGQALDFYVPDESALHRAVRLLGTTETAANAAASIRVAPVPSVTALRSAPVGTLPWPLAHPLFVALDLAQDVGRGREILQAWRPEGDGERVW
ncbi:GntR family transcriptional regulator [Nocardioides alcanivorans]|uniref:GntR family transcriptional regulator n=1 Tax=Nocardioides alcanivorans TaxID=2897352 RepID=UPI001F2111FF|nr:GntR family transcriptional regulator [Nocardioides alcanivorans]